MSFFTKNNFLYKLIICICIVLALMNSTATPKAYAAETGVGGLLISPICDLLLGLGDAIMNIIQKSVMGKEAILVVDNTKEVDWLAIGLAILVIAAAVVLSVVTCGGFAAFLAAITPALIKAAVVIGVIMIATSGQAFTVASAIAGEVLGEKVVLPIYAIGPEEIFSGRILLFDANVFNPKDVTVDYKNVQDGSTGTKSLKEWNDNYNPDLQGREYYYFNSRGEKINTSTNNSAYELRNIISKWYYIIRSIALVGSMLILIYVGIRIMISSIAEEKAKYKQMLGDWVIALCLIFLMHYIMVFAHSIVESVTDIFNSTLEEQQQIAIITKPTDKLIKGIKEIGKERENNEYAYLESDESAVYWPTNQMGRWRVEAQENDGKIEYVGFTVAYLVLVIFTLTFAITYLKRLIYLLFLTVIAPLVALTYPIDKIHDGKAQAFDMWLKEYIFNLMIQPFHLILYTIFATMAFELASTNIIYSLVVIGFMIPAEKFLRTMFGFNKASTPGMLGGAAGAAVAMSAMKSLDKFAKGGKGDKGSGGGNSGKDDKGKLRTADSGNGQTKLFGEVADEGEGSDSSKPIDNSAPEQEKTTQQKMLDAYDEDKFGTDEYDPAERDAMARDAYGPESREYSAEEFRQILEDTGYEPEEIEAMMREHGYDLPDESKPEELPESKPEEKSLPAPKPTGKPKSKLNGRKGKSKKVKNGRSVGRAIGGVLKRSALPTGRFVLNTASNLALGGVGAMVGLAAGIASGDPSKAFTNTTIGAGVGVSVSKGLNNRAQAALSKGQKTAEQIEKDYWGSEYSQHMKDKADDAFRKDKELQRMYREQLGLDSKADVKEAMDAAVEYRKYGINDNNVIIRAMKADNGHKGNWRDKKRIAAAQLAEISKNEKDLQTHIQRFAKTPGITKKQVEDMERRVRQINNL